MNKLLDQLKQMVARLSPRQRMIAGGGALATLLAVGLLVKSMTGSDYKPLMSGLEPEDASAIQQQLAAKKIDFRPTPDGRGIEVAAAQLDAARMEVASQGSTHSGRLGFELFDKASWGQTEFDEKVNYQRALEGELERTIGTLHSVKSARVHLVLSHDSVFLDRERAAKASVTLRLKRGNLTDEELEAIARLVSGAVEDLAPTDVAIIDADSNTPLNRHSSSTQGRELEAELTRRLLATLGPAVGLDNLRASVNVEYDLSTSEENQDKYDPAVSALLTTQKSSQQSGALGGDGGVAGTSANLPGDPAQGGDPGATPGGTQTASTENSTFGVNKVARHTLTPAGTIRRITAAILVNDAAEHKLVNGKLVASPNQKRTPDQLKQLQTLASAVLGADPNRGDLITVENMTFAGASDSEVPPTLAEKLQSGVTQFATPLKYASMLLLFVLAWALVLRPLQKTLSASMKQLPAPDPHAAAASAVEMPATPELPVLTEDPFDKLIEADSQSVSLKRKLSDMVQSEPVAMARTVQAWLQES